MPLLATDLAVLLTDCTVRITVPGDAGTGFFVGQGLVLTCAHVIKQARLDGVEPMVRWGDIEQPAVFAAVLPEPSPALDFYPYPDLALLQVPISGHPCVCLSLHQPMGGDPAFSWGYPAGYDHGDPVRGLAYEGVTGGGQEYLKLGGAQVTPGMSGAPLLNLRSGTVDGIVKLTRDEGAALGARGIPASTILRVLPQLADAQASHLRHDYRWVANMTPWQRWQANLEAEADEKRAVTDCLRAFSEDRLVAALACLPPRSAQEMPTSAAEALSGRLFGADLALLKMVAAEKLGPNPAWNALDVYEMVGPHAWITVPAAARLRDLLDAPAAAGTRPVAVLNMAEEETGRLYVRFASRTYPLPLTWRVTVWQRDPLETAEDALAASLTAAVREALPRGVPLSAHDLFIKNNHVVVVIPPPPPDAALLARLQSAQPGVTFLLLAGSSADDTVAALAASPAIQPVLLEPEGDPQLEQAWAQEFWLTRLTLKESP